ncbi:MAG: hypothetical protein Q4P32_12940 [Micrococcales bacterium]|nr:hypothetical protein [Micrococcales bacterium]
MRVGLVIPPEFPWSRAADLWRWFRVRDAPALPGPVQQPRIPFVIAAHWPCPDGPYAATREVLREGALALPRITGRAGESGEPRRSEQVG